MISNKEAGEAVAKIAGSLTNRPRQQATLWRVAAELIEADGYNTEAGRRYREYQESAQVRTGTH